MRIIFLYLLFDIFPFKRKQILEHVTGAQSSQVVQDVEQIFTDTDLLQYNGKESEYLYLVILGHVYDVTKGLKHYGLGQAYHMFIGHDASRSFVTGEFDKYSDELSDVSSLTDAELQQLLTWKEFYDKTYDYVGKAVGRYFDDEGQPTAYYNHVLTRASKAEQSKDVPKFPSCNVEWKPETGTRVWCTNRSGNGQERSWVGRPRKIVPDDSVDGQNTQFCACVPEKVSDEQYVPFPGCDENAESCVVPDQN
ncbi:neuferricin homolog [Anopheles nili]|uniref:neuferricin homolog n=1 Tax=Anopheles nili TaxID=185578 RepID=UPI00237B7178|nr:neuferricin homolog [Anopheles nili]